jgi:D-sedoheptulose 7-phosphate isomerase
LDKYSSSVKLKYNGMQLQEALSRTIESQLEIFEKACVLVLQTFQNKRKLLICGNGGSAADAQHLAAEFVSSFKRGISRKGLPAIALTTDTSILTAYSNDFNFSGVFARQIEAIGEAGDLLIVFSTSGKSKNCIEAIAMAKSIRMKSLSFSSADSLIGKISDLALEVQSNDTQRIQEIHMYLYHTLCEVVEEGLLNSLEKL